MKLLFEYSNSEECANEVTLKLLLQNIWAERMFVDLELGLTEEAIDRDYQPFLKFDGKNVKANNYIGFIQNDNELIEIYPKVFRNIPSAKDNKELMLRHIFYWFSYCRKWKFPFNKASLDTLGINEFPELIINLIANQFLETISNQPLTMYQPVEEALITPRGSINFNRYISKSLSHGNFQNIECDYEPFLFDNGVNRIIKYCTRLLMNQTKFSQRTLQEVLFILDEVEDVPCTIQSTEKISLNSFYESYKELIDSCKLILSQQLYSNNVDDLSHWCLLFPMEYIFEDFFAGFLENKFSEDWDVQYQKSDMNLSNAPSVFNMQHDIFLTSRHKPNRKIIIDTKYKLRQSNFKLDPKKGIEQSDLYQMISYAFKRGCSDIILIYPNLSEEINAIDKFEIISGFGSNEKINVFAMEIPFWSLTDINGLDDRILNSMKQTFTQILATNI
jgi:5-methylcytosine-specific restriction enzyme subunit McrC